MPTRTVDPFAVPDTGDQSDMSGFVTPTVPGAKSLPTIRDEALPTRRAWESVTDTLGPHTPPEDILALGRQEVAQQMAQANAVREEGNTIRRSWNPLSSDKAGPDNENAAEDKTESNEKDDQPGPDANFGDYISIIGDGDIPRSAETVSNMLTMSKNAAAALPSDIEQDIVDYVGECFGLSYEHISRRYDTWTEADQTHDLYVPTATVEAMQASTKKGRRRKPRIIDVIRTPYSRAICDVRCTYNLAIFGGMPAFKIYPARRTSSRLAARIIEAELSNNMRRVGYERLLYQITLDQNRYGISPVATYYGQVGNIPLNIDPWSYFPDPRVTLQNAHEADFVGVRTTASISALYRRKLYANLERVEKNHLVMGWDCNRVLNENQRGTRPDTLRDGGRTETPQAGSKFGLGRAHVLNTIYAYISPKWFGINAPFGLYRIVVADEKTVIMFDKSPYPHGQIPVVSGACDWDAHKIFASSAYELGAPLQRFQDWLLRARVENTQNLIRGRMIADPTKVMIDDILNPNTARLIRALPGADLKSALLPIDQKDSTASFWQEMDQAAQLQQRLLAANDTAQGVQTDTQRSATEIARLTSLGQQRLGTQARMLSASQIRPMVLQMVWNLQYFGVFGGQVQLPPQYAKMEDGWYEWKQKEVLGEFDYLLSDGTLPADPRANSENLMRAIRVIGETNTGANWNMAKIFNELFISMGFNDVEEWQNTQKEGQAQNAQQQAAAMANNPGVQQQIAAAHQQMAQTKAQVQPDEQVMKDKQAGNVVPLSEAMRATAAAQSSPQAQMPLQSEPTQATGVR
jgi:hypothetical protein